MYILYQKILENANEIFYIDFIKKICYNKWGYIFKDDNIWVRKILGGGYKFRFCYFWTNPVRATELRRGARLRENGAYEKAAGLS
jgi:hypothetical protein